MYDKRGPFKDSPYAIYYELSLTPARFLNLPYNGEYEVLRMYVDLYPKKVFGTPIMVEQCTSTR